jgi:hypothetical protein
MTQPAEKAELKPETLLAYTAHIAAAEAGVEARLRGEGEFLNGCTERLAQLRKGAIIVELYSGERPLQVPEGLVHDWIGVICIPGTTIDKTLALLQNYDNHKNIYQPGVAEPAWSPCALRPPRHASTTRGLTNRRWPDRI